MKKKNYFVDPSALKSMSCDRKLSYVIKEGYRSKTYGHKLEWGSAFHAFAAAYYRGADEKSAIAEAVNYFSTREKEGMIVPESDHRNLVYLLDTCMKYAKKYPIKSDIFKVAQNRASIACVEQSFMLPLFLGKDYNIWFSGTIDVLGTYGSSKIFMDHKTTGLSAGSSGRFFANYELDTQFLGYNYALRRLSEASPEVFGEYNNVAGIVNGVFLSKGGASFVRSEPITFPQHLRNDFSNYMETTLINRLCSIIEDGPKIFGFTSDSCTQKWGKCAFWDICSRPDNIGLDTLATMLNYEKKPYNPLNHGKL